MAGSTRTQDYGFLTLPLGQAWQGIMDAGLHIWAYYYSALKELKSGL